MLANLRPSGKYLMEDFFYAGGLRAFLTQLGDLLDFSQQTVNGRTLGANIEGAKVFNDDVIRPRNNPLLASDGLAVLTGNLAPGGAVIKPAAMEPQLRQHRGPAVVFKDYNDMAARIDDPALEVTKDSVIVLQSAGPQGAPGMPEWGQLPIPQKLLKEGVRDMLRISDARMSGTSYGACVLHVTPESHVGGPLALVRDGDLIELDVRGTQYQPAGERGRARATPGFLAGPATQVHPRLWRALPQAHPASRYRLRFRFSRDREGAGQRCRRARNSLTYLVPVGSRHRAPGSSPGSSPG